MNHDKILILDFGSQVTQLIARRIREASVYCELHPADVSDEFIREFRPKGIILSGSHMSAYEESTDRAPSAVFELGVPVLGICYGMQTMAQQLGGRVEGGHTREFGHAQVRARGHTRLLDGIEDRRSAEGHGLLNVWMSHGDKVVEMPAGFRLMASTESCPIAGMADESRRFYAVQFHPEVTHTSQGRRSCAASCSRSAAASPTGSWATMLPRRCRDPRGCRGRGVISASRAAWIPPSRQR
jgi:GMP synthase (glutamine-hydrolysing)